VFPVRYEHHLHIQKLSYLRNRPRRPIGLREVEDLTFSRHKRLQELPILLVQTANKMGLQKK
jgi:hypothetical protein